MLRTGPSSTKPPAEGPALPETSQPLTRHPHILNSAREQLACADVAKGNCHVRNTVSPGRSCKARFQSDMLQVTCILTPTASYVSCASTLRQEADSAWCHDARKGAAASVAVRVHPAPACNSHQDKKLGSVSVTSLRLNRSASFSMQSWSLTSGNATFRS